MTSCPFCGSDETERTSAFGTSLMVAAWYCRACRTNFESVKWGDANDLDLPPFLDPRTDEPASPAEPRS